MRSVPLSFNISILFFFFKFYTNRDNDHVTLSYFFILYRTLSFDAERFAHIIKKFFDFISQVKNNLIDRECNDIILIKNHGQWSRAASCMRARACLKMAARSPRGRRSSRAEARRAESVTITFECVRNGGTMVVRRGDLPFLATVIIVAVAGAAATAEGGRAL